MKYYVSKNIDLFQISIKNGVTEYAFPRNVDWAGKKIDRMLICAPINACQSPIDGTAVVTGSDLSDLYLDLYGSEDRLIAQNLHYSNLMYNNNNALCINDVLSLQLCRLRFSQAPLYDKSLLVYVFYGGTEMETEDIPCRTETVIFPMSGGQSMTFTEIINTYFHVRGENVRGVVCWNAETDPVYLSLRDHELNYVINDVHSAMARPDMNLMGAAPYAQKNPLYLDNADIDFDYSSIRNATNNGEKQIITFLY